LVRYKGKIYPANRIHSAWVGFEEQGKPGLNQLFMKDFFQMWMLHRADPKNKYPALGKITDDNHDGVIEVNRPEEIDALLSSVKEHLSATGFPMEGRRLVWVSDSRAYYSSTESRDLPRDGHEATAYASVYKFSHDVSPAKAALGTGGCRDCHGAQSHFFRSGVLAKTFSDVDASPAWIPNYRILGLSYFTVQLGAFREGVLKPVLYGLLGFNALLIAVLFFRNLVVKERLLAPRRASMVAWVALAGLLAVGGSISRTPGLIEYMTFSRFNLDAQHFWVGLGVAMFGVVVFISNRWPDGISKMFSGFRMAGWMCLGLFMASGVLMLLNLPRIEPFTRLTYTTFDASLVAITVLTATLTILRLALIPPEQRQAAPSPDE
jgi:hypothetical protein